MQTAPVVRAEGGPRVKAECCAKELEKFAQWCTVEGDAQNRRAVTEASRYWGGKAAGLWNASREARRRARKLEGKR